MSPAYLLGSVACTSMGLGTPPGPPLVSAEMNLRNNALCLVLLTSSMQYLCSTGLDLSAVMARVSRSGTSGPSSSASVLHSPWTHRASLSCAFSW